MIKFEFESLEELQHVLEAMQAFHQGRTKVRLELDPFGPLPTLAETFLWVYEKTGE